MKKKQIQAAKKRSKKSVISEEKETCINVEYTAYYITSLRHYGLRHNYGITALRHLRFTVLNYGVELFYVDNKKINKSIKKNDDDNTSNLLIELKEKQNQNEDHYLSKQNENPETSHKKINKNIKRNNEEVTDDDPFINLKKRQRQNEDYIGLAYKDLVSVNKGNGKFGFLDVFVLGECYTNIELKYIPLTGLVSNTDGKDFDANELGELDKVIEREDEDILLRRQYRYYDKKTNKYICTTINDILNNGAKQLERYMRIIAKGQANKYSTGVCDERIKIINSNPNKLIGFVIVVIGFRRIIWRSVDEKLTTNYRYIKIN
ncbi:hypothetical protein RhiirA5_452459 [Rhizophagus irregularis]|uniref:Uncharacterized protein n=1 Tax=Rhizophagus irregularis TaxID=588596 RepID=A0A2N0P889_9GLOM|nr:hypothetical protein RhiirA5_452459 [Rhizophagus irregularis]